MQKDLLQIHIFANCYWLVGLVWKASTWHLAKLLRYYYFYWGITLTVASCCFRRLLEMKNNTFASFYLNAIIVVWTSNFTETQISKIWPEFLWVVYVVPTWCLIKCKVIFLLLDAQTQTLSGFRWPLSGSCRRRQWRWQEKGWKRSQGSVQLQKWTIAFWFLPPLWTFLKQSSRHVWHSALHIRRKVFCFH